MKPYDPVKRREEYLKNYDKYKEQRKTYAENNKDSKNKGALEYYYKKKVEDPVRYLLKYVAPTHSNCFASACSSI